MSIKAILKSAKALTKAIAWARIWKRAAKKWRLATLLSLTAANDIGFAFEEIAIESDRRCWCGLRKSFRQYVCSVAEEIGNE